MTTLEEWKAEYRRLAVRPGPSVAVVWWRTYLDQNRDGPYRYRSRPCNRAVRQMKPWERAEFHENRTFAQNTQVLRTGRNSWYVIEPEPRDQTARVRVY